MLNRRPIFIDGFNRGGTNILQFILISHPDICVVRGETHEVFYGRHSERFRKWMDRLMCLPIVIASRQHYFYNRCLEERRPIPKIVYRYIDWILYKSKLNFNVNRLKDQDSFYTRKEVRNARMLCKNTNGVVFASELFSKIYPDATFIGLIRNGFALCEGYVHRGASARQFAEMYEKVCHKMVENSKRIPRYYLFSFEDLLKDPAGFTKKLFHCVGLDAGDVKKICLQAKLSMDRKGSRKFKFGEKRGQKFWIFQNELSKYLRRDVNENQIARLCPQDRETVRKYACESMKYFGYL